MTRKIFRLVGGPAGAGALGLLMAVGALGAGAQETRPRVHVERQECRCVDKDGKPVERCTCIVTPDVDRIVTRAIAQVGGRARLGVALASGDEGDARGARVVDVMEDGPAAQAGLRKGDVITRLDGKSLLDPLGAEVERRFHEDGDLPVQRLMALVRDIEPGQDVLVEYLRGSERRTTSVKARALEGWGAPMVLGSWDADAFRERMGDLEERLGRLRWIAPEGGREIRLWTDSAGAAPRVFFRGHGDPENVFLRERADGRLRSCPGSSGAGGFLVLSDRCPGGLALVALNPGLAEYFGTAKGVLVADVHPDSKLGLRAGDVILSVGDRSADDPDRLRRILDSYGADESVSFRVMRQKRELQVQGTLAR